MSVTNLASMKLLSESDIPFVDELSAAQVKHLQQTCAEQHNIPIVFSDPLQGGGTGPQMAVIPHGRYEMGSDEKEYGHSVTEYPQHLVTLRKPFAIGIYPVLTEEFELFRQATEWQLRKELIWHSGRYPAINLRMQDVRLYLDWLSKQSGHTYRLPTEAEWEYAARAGTTTPFHQGSNVSCKNVHFNPNFPYQEAMDKRRWYLPRCFPSIKVSAAGLHEPNNWGLYDVHGNVWEFTSSHWTSSHLNANRDGSPSAGADPYWYVTKGGSWFDGAVMARSAARKKRYLDEMDTNLGFRVVRELS